MSALRTHSVQFRDTHTSGGAVRADELTDHVSLYEGSSLIMDVVGLQIPVRGDWGRPGNCPESNWLRFNVHVSKY